MASANESSAREPAFRGRGRSGRGGRGGRGRGGGGRGASSNNAAVPKSASNRQPRGGTRRGRAKMFGDPSVQAAYERQRDLRDTYAVVSQALRSAVTEMNDRTLLYLESSPDAYRDYPGYDIVVTELEARLDDRLALTDRQRDANLELARKRYEADQYIIEQSFNNSLKSLEENFVNAQEERLRIINALRAKDLPIDVSDDRYEYRVISDKHLDNDFGIYECRLGGHLIPYPSRVPGTEMWRKGQAPEHQTVATAASTPLGTSNVRGAGRGRGRGANKRRTQDQPDGQPAAKKNTRSCAESELLPPTDLAPVPAKGLLAAAAEAETQPETLPTGEESSGPTTPVLGAVGQVNEPPAAAIVVRPSGVRERSPALPRNIAPADEHGFRTYNVRSSTREKGISSRLVAPRPFTYNDWEIGFRDSTNDPSFGHTAARRGKYIHTPNTNFVFYDFWCNGYNYALLSPEDFDKDLIKRHRLHPRYGIFMAGSINLPEPSAPCVMPGKPVVFIAQPSGRVVHASRSFQATVTQRSANDAPIRSRLGASLRAFRKLAGEASREDISVDEFLPTDEELRGRSLGTVARELESRPETEELSEESEEQPDLDEIVEASQAGAVPGLSFLTYATAFVEAKNATARPVQAPSAPKMARYDAIRDVFTDSAPAAPPAAPETDTVNLNFLAELCNMEARLLEPPVGETLVPKPLSSPAPAPVRGPFASIESDPRSTVRRGELSFTAPLYHPAPMNAPPAPVEPANGYATQKSSFYEHRELPRELPPLQPAGHAHALGPEPLRYQAPHEQNPNPPMPVTAPPPLVRSAEYPQLPPPPPTESYLYYSHSAYSGSPPRDVHMPPARPMEPSYIGGGSIAGSARDRRSSSYGTEASGPVALSTAAAAAAPPPPAAGYHHCSYWSQPPAVAQPPPPPSLPPQTQHYQPPAQLSHSRMPFSQGATAEPLPPLRPPRSRAEDVMPQEQAMRPAVPSMTGYYPTGPPRPHHHHMMAHELAPLNQAISLPQGPPPYMGTSVPPPPPPSQTYSAHQILSPTFSTHPSLMSHLGQSPPPSHRHRASPSVSSDTSGKYRKLQPAPVPPHRIYSAQPELKTIPYDHKEIGKRTKADKMADSLNGADDSR